MSFSFKEFFNNLSASKTQLQAKFRIDNRNTDIASQLSKPFKADENYFAIWVNEMFLYKDREWLNGYEPIVFAFTNFQYGTQKNMETPFVVGRTLIADKKINIPEGILFQNTQIAGVHPYAGDKLTIYMVLSKYRSEDYLEKSLRFIEKIAGVFSENVRAILERVSGIATVLKEGIESFHDSPDVIPVLGSREELSSQVKDIMPGYFVMINRPENEVSQADFFVKDDKLYYGNSLKDCQPYRESDYVLYSLVNIPSRQDEKTLSFYPQYLELKSDASEVIYIKDDSDDKDKERYKLEKERLNQKFAVVKNQIDLSFDLITSQKKILKEKYFQELTEILKPIHLLSKGIEKKDRTFESEEEHKLFDLETESVNLKI